MWTLVILSVIAALLGVSVTIFYALRIANMWSVELDPLTNEPTVVGTLAPPALGTLAPPALGTLAPPALEYAIPDVDASINVVDFLSDAPDQFVLESYVNVSGVWLDDTYLGTYVRGDINTVTDYSAASLATIGPRLAVWVDSSNPERIIGLYYNSNRTTYQFEITAYQNSETYGERLTRAALYYDATSANIVDVSGPWKGANTTQHVNIVFSLA